MTMSDTDYMRFSGGTGNQLCFYTNFIKLKNKNPNATYSFNSIGTLRDFDIDWFNIKYLPSKTKPIKDYGFRWEIIDEMTIDMIRNELVPRNNLTRDELDLIHHISGRNVLHIRRTDFLTSNHHKKNVGFHENIQPTGDYAIISDDEYWCEENLSHYGEVIPTSHLSAPAIIYACKYAKTIVPNQASSFCRWCGYLNKYGNGKV